MLKDVCALWSSSKSASSFTASRRGLIRVPQISMRSWGAESKPVALLKYSANSALAKANCRTHCMSQRNCPPSKAERTEKYLLLTPKAHSGRNGLRPSLKCTFVQSKTDAIEHREQQYNTMETLAAAVKAWWAVKKPCHFS